MSRWTAPSSDDYYESVEARSTWDRPAVLHCIKCEREVYVDADEEGPVWCSKCRLADDTTKRETSGEAA